MKITELLTKTTRRDVAGHPVGLGVYIFNPYALGNVSGSQRWEDIPALLSARFNRFLQLFKVKRFEPNLLSGDMITLGLNKLGNEFAKIREDLIKPNSRLVWKIFWVDESQEVINLMTTGLKELDISGWSPHSKAVYYHHLAIQNALRVVAQSEDSFQFHLWEQAFEYWNETLNSPQFMESILNIIRNDGAAGYTFFRQYNINNLKDEITLCILNTFEILPMMLIDELHTDDRHIKGIISKFIRTLINSSIGKESDRIRVVKNIVSKRIARDVHQEFSSINFSEYIHTGDYLNLYKNGMIYIDRIKEITQTVYDEAHDQNLHSRTFLSQVIRIPDLHELVVMQLVKALLLLKFDDNITMEVRDRTFFTQLILDLRLLLETKLNQELITKLSDDVDNLSKRFSINNLKTDDIRKLNEKVPLFLNHNSMNISILTKYYCIQYCWFCEGEFANPKYSIIEMRKRVNGNVVFTDQVFIPRSELAWKFHERKLTDDQVFSMRRFIDGVEEIKDELEKLNHQLKGLQDHRVKLELIISQYEQERKEIIAQHEKKRKILEEIIEREITNELKKEENLVQIRLNEVEMERNKKKIKEEKDKRATEIRSLRKSMQYFLNGAIFMAIATIVLLFLDGILGIAGYILLALTGGFVVYFIIRRSRLATAIKSAQSELDEQVKELNGKTEDCKTRIDVIKKKVRKKLINSFKPKKEGLEHELEINLENLSKHHNVGEVKANVDALDKEIKLVNTKIENLKKRLSGSIATKPFAEYKKSILYKKFNY